MNKAFMVQRTATYLQNIGDKRSIIGTWLGKPSDVYDAVKPVRRLKSTSGALSMEQVGISQRSLKRELSFTAAPVFSLGS